MDLGAFLAEWHNADDRVLVHTSGSTGQPKPLWVEKRRMEASARITCRFLGLKPGDTALLCMPLDYIAGKMMVVRSLTCGLHLLSVDPSGHPLRNPSLWREALPQNTSLWDGESDVSLSFAAMVPMQVYNSLRVPEERNRLMQIRHLIIGGGAVDEEMARELRPFPNAVWSTYGMTETLSHIALRRLSGPEASEWYTPFESVKVGLTDEGCLTIEAPAVCDGLLVTNDLAEVCDGRFRILGRRDNVICSGGVKIQIEDVERVLRQFTHVPFFISKRKDNKFGEVVVMLTTSGDLAAMRQLCEKHLPKYWQPRHYVNVDTLPFTETGKPARREAEKLASAH